MTISFYTRIFISISMIVLISACGPGGASYPELDLMSHGLPIKINAPQDAEVAVDDLGIMKDVTVKGTDNYSVQIFSSEAESLDVAKLIAGLKSDIEASAFFSKIISEDESGFIYEKVIDEDFVNYDFRSVKIQGDTKYVFQAGFGGKYTQAEIEKIYNSVK